MEYVKALEEERRKILVFERELPLSLQLVNQAIEACKKRQRGEESLSEGPALEEFMPLKPSCSLSDEEDDDGDGDLCGGDGFGEKPDWLRSVQLWNQHTEIGGDGVKKPIAMNAKRIGGAFHPFKREKKPAAVKAQAPVVVEVPESSTTENTNGGGGSREEKEKEKDKEGHSQRKARRCWSPELHRRFLHALQQLGGSHVATPKQIRELMKVDGLTNDEVKSHLQKYRLHNRRPETPAVQNSSTITPQQPQIVLVGGLWMPPPEYTAAAAVVSATPPMDTAGTPSNTVYAPVASLPPELRSQQHSRLKSKRSPSCPLSPKRRNNGDINSEGADRTNSDSPATSASSQTTTA